MVSTRSINEAVRYLDLGVLVQKAFTDKDVAGTTRVNRVDLPRVMQATYDEWAKLDRAHEPLAFRFADATGAPAFLLLQADRRGYFANIVDAKGRELEPTRPPEVCALWKDRRIVRRSAAYALADEIRDSQLRDKLAPSVSTELPSQIVVELQEYNTKALARIDNVTTKSKVWVFTPLRVDRPALMKEVLACTQRIAQRFDATVRIANVRVNPISGQVFERVSRAKAALASLR